MKKLALFALLGLFVACFAFAQSEQPTQQQPSAYPEQQPTASESKQMSSTPFVGTIDNVDLTAKSFTVKIEKTGETKTFTFDDKTKWDAKDKMFKADNLKAGDQVTIQADANNLATKIKVKEPASEKQ
jgi:cytoskeletal protein RodZ